MTREVRAGAEFRVSGRTLAGPAVVFGDVSPEHRERFEPGAFGASPAAPLNIQHDARLEVLAAGEYDLADTGRALDVRAVLPPDSAAIRLVQRGALNGFSVEFVARAERRDGGIRVVERAALVGVGLVDVPSYPGSLAEVRARGARGGRLGTLRGVVPTGRALACECGPEGCIEALFEAGALDGAITKPEVLATVGTFAQAFAAKSKKGVRFWRSDRGLEYAVDVPPTDVGQALMEQMRSVPVFARPVVDVAESSFDVDGRVARYRKASVRGLIVKPTDRAAGWSPVVLGKDDAPEGPPARRRSAPWLL